MVKTEFLPLATHAERVELSTIRNPDGSTEGRDPRSMPVAEFALLGHVARPLLAVIKAKCLDCCCYQITEVYKCTAYGCALWPFRRGTNPFRTPMSEERRASIRARNPHFGKEHRENTGEF